MTTYTGTPGNDSYSFPQRDEDTFFMLGGDDSLTLLSTSSSGGAFIDAGDGSDRILVAGSTSFTSFQGLTHFDLTGDFTIVTGSGNDIVTPFARRVTVTDFNPAFDRIDLALSDQLFPGREAYQIFADGSDTVIVHLGGFGQIRLLNVAPSSLNAVNFLNETPITAILTGTTGPDELSGTSLAEKLTGGPGNDSLTGGGSSDLFLFGSRTDGVDQIHDFKSRQDWIGIDSAGFGRTPGDLAEYFSFVSYDPSQTLFFEGALNGQQFPNPTIVYDPASYTITWVQSATPDGSGGVTYDATVLAQLDPASTLSYAGSGNFGVQPTNWILSGTGKFGTASVVWREPGSGHVELWSSGQHFDLGFSKGPAWTLAAVADVDGDGTSDILWRNIATGQVDDWRMHNEQWGGSIDLGAGKGTAWQLAGTGDFNGDSTDDILWRNGSSGQIDQWQMKNANWAGSIDLGTKTLDWVVAGTGDFNGDGTDDILWRNQSTGQVDEWQMQNGNWARSIDLGANKGANWEVVGVADLNENGTADILWRDLNTGETDAWIMKDGNWAGSAAIGPRDTAFEAAGIIVAPFGLASVIWHNPTTGQTDTWAIVSTAPSHAYDYLIV